MAQPDAFSRLKNRTRPIVPPRDTSLVKNGSTTDTEASSPHAVISDSFVEGNAELINNDVITPVSHSTIALTSELGVMAQVASDANDAITQMSHLNLEGIHNSLVESEADSSNNDVITQISHSLITPTSDLGVMTQVALDQNDTIAQMSHSDPTANSPSVETNDQISSVNDALTEISQTDRDNDQNATAQRVPLLNEAVTKLSHSELTASGSNSKAPEEEPLVIRSTIRLEADIEEKLRSFCQRQKITKDTFLEAAFLVISEQPEVQSAVLQLAKERAKGRKQVGEKRKLMTMLKKLQPE